MKVKEKSQAEIRESIAEAIEEFLNSTVKDEEIIDISAIVNDHITVIVLLKETAIFFTSSESGWKIAFDSDTSINIDEEKLKLIDGKTLNIAQQTLEALDTFFYRRSEK